MSKPQTGSFFEALAEPGALSIALDSISDIMQSATSDGKLSYVNQAWCDTLGYSREHATRMSVFDIVAQISIPHCKEALAGVLRGEHVRGAPVVLVARDGTHIRAEVNASCIMCDGKPMQTCTVFRNVEQLRRTEDDRDRFFSLTLDLLCVAGFDGFFKRINPAWQATLGYSQEDMLTTPFIEFVHPEDRERTLAEFGAVLGGEDAVSFENRYRAKDGSYRWMLWNATAFREDELVYATARDISERKLAELELQQLRNTLDQTKDMIAVFDPATLRFSYVNDGAIHSTGYSREQLLAMRPDQLKPAYDEASYREFIAPLVSGEVREATFETVHRRADGSEFPVEVLLQYLPGDEGGAFVNIARDITERREVERMKDDFVSTVSHELRTPLSSIRGSLGLLEGGVAGDLSEKGVGLIKIARQNCDRLVRLINDLLDLEKMRTGKLRLNHAALDAAAVVDRVQRELHSMAHEAGVELRSDIPSSVTLFADEDRVVQVLTNLVANAIKFSGAETKVAVRVMAAGTHARFEVSDQGPGIPDDAKQDVFRRFEQLESGTRRTKGGSGLGLAICKNIVEQHGGEIGVTSEPGEGSTFWFVLPHKPEVRELVEQTGRLVMLVEDDTDLHAVLHMLLTQEGFTVVSATTLAEARERLAEQTPELVILDVGLPDGDGLHLARDLSSHEPPIPVLITSGRNRPDLSFGAPLFIDWLQKPFDDGELISTIRRAMRPGGAAPRVLIIDDDADIRLVLSELLSPLGADLLEASDGVEAIRMAREHQPDAIILDVGMPGLDGFEVIDVLRRGPARATPVLVYTGRDLAVSERDSLALGMTKYLTKAQASEQQLVGAVRELLNGLLHRKGGEE